MAKTKCSGGGGDFGSERRGEVAGAVDNRSGGAQKDRQLNSGLINSLGVFGDRRRKQRRSCFVAEVLCSAKSLWVENRFDSEPNQRDFSKATVIKLQGFAS
ncbi:hypothetical protein U1Q18_023046 [Sarracenia purpurea var. burkii]